MLTYATAADFIQMKDIGRSGLISISDSSIEKIEFYLRQATQWINRYTRREFIPWVEERVFPVPYSFYDLRVRRFPSAHLKLDQDLLEIITLTNGSKTLKESSYYTLEHNIYPKSIVVVKFPDFWGGQFGANINTRYDEAVVKIEGIWGYADYQYPREYWVDTLQVIESGGITANQTTFNVSTVDSFDNYGERGFATGNLLRIDNELMEVTAIDPTLNSVTVKRGVRGSSRSAHDANSVIKRWRVRDDIMQVCLTVAKQWREANLAAGGRIGVSDQSVGVEIGIPADALEIAKSYTRSILYG